MLKIAKKQVPIVIQAMLHLVLVLLGVSALVFVMSQFVSGDIAETIVINRGLEPTREEIDYVKEELGLHESLAVQYQRWIMSVLQGDFGSSYRTQQPVLHEIAFRFPTTLMLGVGAASVSMAITFILGIASIADQTGSVKKLCSLIYVLGTSIPTFVIALGCMYLFSVRLRWVQITKTNTVKDYILPVVTLSLSVLPSSLRIFQTSMLENMNQTFVKVLQARGFSLNHILCKDVVKVALLPWLTQFSVTMGQLLGGSVIVETVFGIGGIGQYIVLSILNRDYPVIQAYVLVMGMIFTLLHLGVEWVISILYPYQFHSREDQI